jgi:hypothetical protein
VLDLINVFKTQNSFHSQNEFLGLGHDWNTRVLAYHAPRPWVQPQNSPQQETILNMVTANLAMAFCLIEIMSSINDS